MKKQLRIVLFGISLGALSFAIAACGGDDCTTASDELAKCTSANAMTQAAVYKAASDAGQCTGEIARQAACITAATGTEVCDLVDAQAPAPNLTMCLSSTTT